MPIHDLHCTRCIRERFDVKIVGGEYPLCRCGAPMTWTPRMVNTDVRGSEQTSRVLDEGLSATGVNKPLSFTSTRERERKMRAMGYEPAGDKVGGARNNDGFKGSLFSFQGQSRRG